MDAVGKTLGSLVVALVGLLVYLGLMVGALLGLGTGAVIYLALLLTAVLMVIVVALTVQPGDA